MNDERQIWESYVKIIKEADVLGRAYRMAKKASGTTKQYSAKEFYNYIKTAQNKAKQILKTSKDRNKPITVFHMINYGRLDRNKVNLIDAIKYLFSKKDEEISVSMDTQPWEIRDSIVLVGTVNDLYEVYDVDTYTQDSKERFPKDIRNIGELDWDEVIINLKDVKWESFYDNINDEQANDLLRKEYDMTQIYSHEDLLSQFEDSPRVQKQTELDEKYKELAIVLRDKYVNVNKFLDFLQGDTSNAEIIRNSEYFSSVLSKLKYVDEYDITELSQWEEDPNQRWESEKVENIRPTTEMGKRISEEDIADLIKSINSEVDIQHEVIEAWDNLVNELERNNDIENRDKIERSKNLRNFTLDDYKY